MKSALSFDKANRGAFFLARRPYFTCLASISIKQIGFRASSVTTNVQF
jgi:hypothetical protein